MSMWRPSTTAILITGVLVVVIAAAVAFMVTTFRPTASVKLGGGAFSLWIAKDEPSRITGLSGVDSLKPNGGLLMAFATDETWGIWMKDMKVPLDIIWLNEAKEVVYIVKNASPELGETKTFQPKTASRYVIELPAGSVQKYNINVGHRAEFDIEGVK